MDNFFANMFRPRQREATTPVGSPTGVPGVPSSTMEGAGKTAQGGSFEERIVYARSPQTALTVSAVHRATELIARTMSIMPVQYRKKDFEGDNFVLDMRGLGKRLNYLLQVQPNPIMTATSMWQLVNINRIFYGNGFVYIERDEFGFPSALWLVKTGGYNVETGTFASIVYLTDHGYATKTDVPATDVLHFPNTFRYQNGIWGIPTLQFAMETLSLIKTEKAQALETAAKGGRVKGFLGEDTSKVQSPISAGMFDPKEVKSYAKEINDMMPRQDIIGIRALDKFIPISMSAAEMQQIQQVEISYDDISRFWGVPRPLLMLDTNSHYNDYQNATMEFHTRTILPLKTEMEKEISRKLIGFKEYGVRDIHICEEPLMAMDPERQAKVDQLDLQNGTKTINEIRKKHDMPAVADGDEPLASANLMTLKALIAKSEAATQLAPGNYTVGEPKPKEGEKDS